MIDFLVDELIFLVIKLIDRLYRFKSLIDQVEADAQSGKVDWYNYEENTEFQEEIINNVKVAYFSDAVFKHFLPGI